MRLILLVFCAVLAQAEIVTNRFIVELSTEPVATHTAGARVSLQSSSATNHRILIQQEQRKVRLSLEQNGARVMETVDTVANALLIETSAVNPEPWANLPNVLRVTPVHTVPMLLDRAVVVNKITDAWAQLGGPSNAGLGMKIAIIDTGVDIGHPAFKNSPLAVPAGFPLVNNTADSAFTNNKVIVARSYVSLLPARDPDTSARDRVGHGTALAMISAGGTVAGDLATITGVASGAWIGSYKVFGSPGVNDSATDAAILKALDDAVKDGMDVVNLSLGGDIASRLNNDPDVQAVERAVSAGVLVVVAAGNNGTDPFTVASPGTAPDAITVGAQRNDRIFSASIQASGVGSFLAIPGSGPMPGGPITATVVDVAGLDSTGLACSALPAGSLSGRTALILRGTCFFEVKLNNAAAAGASAAIIYATAESPDAIAIGSGTATLPAEMISHADGITLKQAVASGQTIATETFTLSPIAVDATRLANFSASGPSVDLSIKPDLVAVGQDYYVATQSFDPKGDMYSATGYTIVDGTSFSTPTVAGAAALLKSARPGLTTAQYRSLLINSATPLSSSVQQSGAGSLNSGASLLATAAAYPTSLSFGAGGSFPQGALNLTITNTGPAGDTFTVRAAPTASGLVPSIDNSAIRVEAGMSGKVSVALAGSNLAPGGYEGFIVVAGANGTVETRVPYWYGVAADTPVRITNLQSTATAKPGALKKDAIYFRVTDAAGLPITSLTPVATITAGGGSVVGVNRYDSQSPGLYSVSVRLGPVAGPNTIQLAAGDLTATVTITGQ